jgi:hypothetical protein
MKRANIWAGLALSGIWLTSSAVANPGRAFHGAVVTGAHVHRGTAFGGFDRDPMRRGDGWRFGRYAYRSRYDYRDHRNGYPDGGGYDGYADPYGYGPYGYGYLGNYLNPGDDDSYTYGPEAYGPEDSDQAADAEPPVKTGVELVTAVQTKLSRQAYYDGPLDGVVNEQMRRAIRQYQQDHGLPVTGLISPELLSSMAIRYIFPLA